MRERETLFFPILHGLPTYERKSVSIFLIYILPECQAESFGDARPARRNGISCLRAAEEQTRSVRARKMRAGPFYGD